MRITDTTAGGAKEVITGYETLAVSGRLALLEVELVTGRTHQIRAHLAHIGCPILGDSKYGNNAANRELRLKYQALCAWELRFPAQNLRPAFCPPGRAGIPRREAVVLPAGCGWDAEINTFITKQIRHAHAWRICFYSIISICASRLSHVYRVFRTCSSSFLLRRGGRPKRASRARRRSALLAVPEMPHSYRSV